MEKPYEKQQNSKHTNDGIPYEKKKREKKTVRGRRACAISLTHGTEDTGRGSHSQVKHGQADVHPDHAVPGDIQTDSR